MLTAAIRARPGPTARRWLLDRIAAIQGADPLRPVTVVVPNHYLGLALRRDLAQRGYANVRFTILARLAEPFGATLLASRDQSPLTSVLEDAAIRSALRADPGLTAFAEHRSAVEAHRSLFRDLREARATAEQRATWAATGAMARAALRAFEVYRAAVAAHRLYDEHDLLEAAAEALNPAAAAALAELGAIVLFLPGRLSPAAIAFLGALATKAELECAFPCVEDDRGDREARALAVSLGLAWSELPTVTPTSASAAVSMLAAPLATEEVRAVVRRVMTDLEAGTPLHRVAILCRREEPYLTLVREALAAAGLPFAALSGKPIATSVVGGGLLGLLRLRERDFARTAVLEWRSTLAAKRGGPSFAEWNRLSREARIVRGIDGWTDGLTRLEGLIDERLGSDPERSEASRRFYERRRRTVTTMRDEIARLAASTAPPAETTWDALVTWAARCRREHVPTPQDEHERDLGLLVDQVLEGLRAAGTLEPTTDLATFVATLEAALEERGRPQGRLGVGVVVGSPTDALGMSFASVYLVGLAEGVFPAAAAADPIFPDGDPLERHDARLGEERRSFLAALAAADGGTALLSVPAWDSSLRPTYAAAWLLEVVGRLAGRPVTAAELRVLDGEPWLARVISPAQALQRADVLLDLAEWRVREASAQAGHRRLAASPLARRTDLPLGRTLEVLRARISSALTRFDGRIGSAPDSPRLREGLARAGASPSALEDYAACPFHYFLGRVLHVQPTDAPEEGDEWKVDPRERGSLVHEVLERFFGELHETGRPVPGERYTVADHDRIEALANEAFTAREQGTSGAASLLWSNERVAIIGDLHTLLLRDEERRAARGVMPSFFEQAFGLQRPGAWPAATVPLARGGEVRLHGVIDRVDLGPDPATPETVVVIDYKTGSRDYGGLAKGRIEADPVVAGRLVQHAVYARAATQWLAARDPSASPTIHSEYWMVSATGKFEVIRAERFDAAQARLVEVVGLIDDGLRRGAFPQVPGELAQRAGQSTWDNCGYCDYQRICPADRDQLHERKAGDSVSGLHARLTLPDAPMAVAEEEE